MKSIKIILVPFALLLLLISCTSTNQIQVLHNEPNTELYHADLNIPIFKGQDELNLLVSKKIGEWFNQFESEVLSIENAYQDEKPMFAFYSDWEKTMDSKSITSFLLTAYSYTGGANGEDKLYAFNWNKKTKKIIALDEILKEIVFPATEETLAKVCETQLRSMLEAQENSSLDEMIQEGTKPLENNFQVFTISKEGVTFYFNKYQVAPGALGIQKVFVPYLKR